MASFNTLYSSRPPIASIKNSILNFVKGLVSTSLYRAFGILLSPCCHVTATATAICDPVNSGDYIINIKLSEGVNLAGNGTVSIKQSTANAQTYIDGATTLRLGKQSIPSGTNTITLQLSLPINSVVVTEDNIGSSSTVVSYIIPNIPITLPSC